MKKTFVVILTLIFWTTFLPSSVFSQKDGEPYCEISNSHVVGDKCYCDDGYINYNGKCRTPEAVCRGFNAHYSAAIKDCKCDDGYVEKNNYCVKEGEKITPEQKKEMEKNKNSAGDGNEQVSSAKQKSEDSVNDEKKEGDGTRQLEEKTNVDSDSSEAGEKLTVEEKFKKMTEEHYSKYDPETQEVIKKNSDKIKELKETSLKPQDDIYGDIEGDSDDGIIIAPFNVPIEESFGSLNEEEKKEAEDKLEFISDFNLGDDQEISLKEEKNVMERVRDNAVDEEFVKETKNWNKEMKEAEKNNKFKEGITKKDFEIEEGMEKRLKWQIATIKKSIGFEHLRIVETTGIVKMDKMHQPISFGTMTGEYKRYFKNKSAVDDNEWSSQGVAFNNSYRNIVGMGKQLEVLKKSLKEQYPKDWKRRYLDVSARPTKEDQEEKIGNVFDFIDKQIKESQDEKD
jgi:hypothetical protein